MFRFSKNLIKIGVKAYTEKKAMTDVVIAAIIFSSNYLTFSCDLMLLATVMPILSIAAN
jgi:hypothetical protein